jgi:hypothetical protein
VDDREPWIPKGMYQPSPGDEVTIDLGECPQIARSHGTQDQGVRGIVVGKYDHPDYPGHPYLVCYRHALPVKGQSGYYSAWELRPFDMDAELQKIIGALRADRPEGGSDGG